MAGSPLEWVSQDLDDHTMFQGSARWNDCPDGYIIGGFYTGGCDKICCLEEMRCIRPDTDELISQTCEIKNISSSFDSAGKVTCDDVDIGYFVKGIYSNTNTDFNCGLDCWDYLRCCKYDENIISVGNTEYTHNDWDTCLDGDWVWCVIDDNEYLTGFYRTSDTDNTGSIYLLDYAYTREVCLVSGKLLYIYLICDE